MAKSKRTKPSRLEKLVLRTLRRSGPAFIVLTGLSIPFAACGQGTTATLGGTVTDSSGAVIPKAQIILKNETADANRTSTSNGSGVFSFSGVPTGTYDVTITAPGFAGFTQNGIHLDPGDQKSIRDIRLTIGASTDAITVSSGADAINIDSGEQSSLISAEEITHLSVEGRDVTELLKILPGFANAQGGGGNVENRAYDPSQVSPNGALGSYAANGSPLNGIALLTDGADITDPGNFGSAVQNVNYEQVAEVKVQTSSFTADGARGPIVINAVGKSGGDAFHGGLYVYARTSQLNSTDWIANYTGQTKPGDRQVYPGFTFGGPIRVPGTNFNKSRKLTFFVGAEQYAQKNAYAYGSASSAVLTALVPTAGMRTGDFSQEQIQSYLGAAYKPTTAVNDPGCAGNDGNICVVPTTGPQGQALDHGNISAYLDPLAKSIFNGMALPNTTSNGTYNYITTNTVDNDLYQARARVDAAITDRNHFFAVYSVERGGNGVPQAEYYSPRGSLGGVNIPGGGLISSINSQIASVNLTSIFSSTLTNEFYGAGIFFKQNFAPKNLAATQGNPYQGIFANGSTVQPTLEDYGYDGLPLSRLPDGTFGGIYAQKVIRTFGDNLTKVIGKNTFRAGLFYQLDTNHQVLPFVNTNGTVNLYYFPETYVDRVAGTVHDTGPVGSGNGGNYLANFAEGHVFQFQQTNFAPAPNLFFFNLDGYFQDHLRLTQRITVDLGLRLEHFTPWGDAHGQGIPVFDDAKYASNANPLLPGFTYHSIDASAPVAGLGTRAAYIEPRVGFAIDVYGKGATILRGGYGIYRAHDSSNDAANGVGTVQGQRSGTVTLTNLSSVSAHQADFTSAGSFTPDVNAFGFLKSDDEQPQIQTYNLSVDQRLPGKMLLEVAYVGNYSNHILNDGSTQNTQLDDLNSLPVGALFAPAPTNIRTTGNAASNPYFSGVTPGTVYPTFNQPTGSAQPLAVGGLNQAQIDSFKKYPLYNHVYVAQHNLYANYNALQVGINKQGGKSNIAVNYTFSKALGVLGGYANGYPGDPINYANDYGEESYDHRHIFNAAYSYQFGDVVKSHLLGYAVNGWEISGITNFQSGSPLAAINSPNLGVNGSVAIAPGVSAGPGRGICLAAASCTLGISNTNILGTPDVNLQPIEVGDPRVGLAKHQYVNGNVFGIPNVGQNGAYRIGYLPGPGFLNSDITTAKRFRVTEKSSFQLRAAAFNFINHGNNSFTPIRQQDYNLGFGTGTLNANSGSMAAALNNARQINPSFGSANLREGRRIMELALRFDF